MWIFTDFTSETHTQLFRGIMHVSKRLIKWFKIDLTINKKNSSATKISSRTYKNIRKSDLKNSTIVNKNKI
jgi:hypothetical protein